MQFTVQPRTYKYIHRDRNKHVYLAIKFHKALLGFDTIDSGIYWCIFCPIIFYAGEKLNYACQLYSF